MASVALKRFFVGRAFASNRLEHTLLPKVVALPVFASDALSSVAYATGEILVALSLVTARPEPSVLPIAIAIASLMAIVVISYRQTVRAYPNGGGAYIVSKDNLGDVPGLIAAAALMFDYMMTVVVSIVAGVFAIASAFPWLHEHKVFLSIAVRRVHHVAEPARRQGVGHAVRDPDLRVHRRDPRVDRSRIAGLSRRMPRGRGRGGTLARRGHGRGGRGALRDPEGLLPRRHRAHRRRGDLERRSGLPSTAVEERGDDPRP